MNAVLSPPRTAREASIAKLDAAIAARPALPVIKALCVHELAKREFKPRDGVLSPWLHTQDLCMVYAPRGVGKTHFALSAAFAVATGTSFVKWTAPQARKVLYLDGELPGGVMQKRLLMHCPDVEPAQDYLRVFTPDLMPDGVAMPDLSTLEGQSIIDTQIEEDTALVIVDNLSAWARTGRENEGESWLPIADWILRLRRRGIAVLFVHHAGKGGQQRGTSKREDLLDVVISLSRPADYEASQGALFKVEFTKARNLMGEETEPLELALGGTEDKAEWTYRTLAESTRERVIALTREGMSQSEIAHELNLNRSTVNRHVKAARESGELPPEGKK